MARTVASCFLLLAICCSSACRREGPWRAAFFDNIDFSGHPHRIVRHHAVDFNWGSNAPLPSWLDDDFAVRWETCVRVKSQTRVTFRLGSDDGSRLFVDGVQIIDNWGRHGFLVLTRTTILSPGTHHLRVDYFEASQDARILLTTTARPASAVIEFTPAADASNETPPCGAVSASVR